MSENPENKVVLEPLSADRGSYCLTPAKTMCHVGIHGQECLFSRGLGSIGANYETDPFVRGTAVSLLGALKWIVPRRCGCYRVLSTIRHQQYGWRHSSA